MFEKFELQLITSEAWRPLYDGDSDAAAKAAEATAAAEAAATEATAAAEAKAAEEAASDGKFSPEQQKKVDEIVAAEKAKVKRSVDKQISQLEAFKNTANLSKKEAADLNVKIEAMRQEYMTKDELAKSDREKSTKATNEQMEVLTKDRDGWKDRYTNSTIERSLIDSAHETKAYNPDQILAILKPNTSLVEKKDDEGKDTGVLEPKVEFSTVDKDGKSIKLTLSPLEAAKKMIEEDRYANLFVSSTKGGLGSFNRQKPSDKGKDGFIKDTAGYIEDRRKQKQKKS